jgi:hypothetical protein
MAIPIDLTKIHWSGVGIAEFQVHGQQAIKDLLASDATATVTINQQAEILHDVDDRRVALTLHIQMQAMAGQPARKAGIAGSFEIQLFFDVENLADLLLAIDGQPTPVVHPQLGLMLAGIAYSTVRGILWTRLAGTPLEGISLPIIEPRSLFLASPPAKRTKKASTKKG